MKSANRMVTAFIVLLTVGLLVTLFIPMATRSTRAGSAAPAITGFNGLQEGQVIGGKVAIEAVVSGSDIAQVVFKLDGPQTARHRERNAPYFFMGDDQGTPRGWDTTQYPDGDYTLTATVRDAAGQRGSLAVHFRIANQTPAQPTAQPEPDTPVYPAPTAQPEPTAQPTAPPAPSGPIVSGFNGAQDGQPISGQVAIEAIVSGDSIAQVAFQLDGPQPMSHVEKNPPYYILGDNNGVPNQWDTTQYPNGDYTLTATATNAAGLSGSLKIYLPILNNVQPQPTAQPTAQPTTQPQPTAQPQPTPQPTAAPQPPASILWSADHETGDFSQWFPTQGQDGGIYNTGSGDASITTDVAHSGRYAAKLTIANADGQNGPQATRIFRVKESRTYPEAYYSVWLYFPESYTPAQWWNLFQFKSRNDTRNDAFWQLNAGNRADGSMYFYMVNWVNQKNYYQTVQNIPVGKWFHLEVYYKQSASNSGHITVWQDGAVLFDLDGITTMFADSYESANWSIANYTDNITPSTVTFYADDAVISTTRVGP